MIRCTARIDGENESVLIGDFPAADVHELVEWLTDGTIVQWRRLLRSSPAQPKDLARPETTTQRKVIRSDFVVPNPGERMVYEFLFE